MKTQETIPVDTPASLSYTPDFQTSEFIVRGDMAVVEQVSSDLEALEAQLLAANDKVPASQPKAAQTAPEKPTDYASVDMSALPRLQTLKMKAAAFMYDKRHSTNMLGLLNERIDNDRNVRFATELGLLSINETYCQKHARAVAKLGRLAQ